MGELLVITGLSGAGRSQAADHFEDLGWFVIDNLPPELMPKVTDLAAAPGSAIERVALVAGVGHYHHELLPALEALRASDDGVRILFLDASTDVLVRRYENTRRRHPLTGADGGVDGLTEAIEHERVQLEPVKAIADLIVDTSDLNVHQLRQRIVDLFGSEEDDIGLQTAVESFGYKHGIPRDADIVLDCRFLPNPHWVDELRPLTGLDQPVRDYVLSQAAAADFLDRLGALFGLLLPAYVAEGKSYLTIALGCTGGQHRSVVMAERIAELLRSHGFNPVVRHRDLNR
jgi:UPF0042 nucleotide-binding protein